MNGIFKPYLPGTIEKYPYQVNYKVNGGMFYMKVHAEDDTEAANKVKEEYFKDEDVEIIEVIEL